MIYNCYQKLLNNISAVIKGKNDEITAVLAAFFANGHVLLEDVPGTGKTMLAKTLSKSIECDFKRVQFTPDLLPSDITGLNIFNMKSQEFSLRKGPVFTNILLADEINRAAPRTQSALLECMEERQVTIDGVSYKSVSPFFVIATQNPIETQGTFPLPEAQLDRFLVKLSLGYADKSDEIEILAGLNSDRLLDEIDAVTNADEIDECQNEVQKINVNSASLEYIEALGIASRTHENVTLGVSTRGLLALKKMSQVFAAFSQRDFITPDDIKKAAVYVLPHRLICRNYSYKNQNPQKAVVEEILANTAVPTE